MCTWYGSVAARVAPSLLRPGLAGLAVAVLLGSTGGCGRPSQPIRIDLLSLLAVADKRPPTRTDDAFVVRDLACDGRQFPAVAVPQPSRIGWSIRIPRKATLRAFVLLAPDRTGISAGRAVFRIGVSGGKLYEQVFERQLRPRDVAADRVCAPVVVDLSAWAGWQWSLFYRPSETAWTLVFSVDGLASSDSPFWLEPVISGIK